MPALAGGRGVHVECSVTVMCSPEDAYAQWQDLTRWPELAPAIESVTLLGGDRSRWVARGPLGVSIEWIAEMTTAEPSRLVAWRSVDDADVDNAGSVRFTPVPGGRGTEVKVILVYAPPGGRVADAVGKIVGNNVDRQVREALRRFKQCLEAHEVSAAHAFDGHNSAAVTTGRIGA